MQYDIVIIGGGAAGLTAALYAARSGLKTVVIERFATAGGVLVNVPVIENWPGTFRISGQELAMKMSEHAKKAGAEIKLLTQMIDADFSKDPKKIKTTSGDFEAQAVIIATGTTHAHLGVAGEEKLEGKGVSYCAPCDGPFFKNKKVAVVGGGNSALSQALFLSNIAASVTLIHRRDSFRAEQALVDQVKAEKKISLLLNHVVSEIIGDEKVSGVKVKDVNSGEEKTIAVDGVFIYVGLNPNTENFGRWLKLDELGFILTDENMQTNIPGVFAVGDVRATPLRQIVTAASDGAIAAIAAGKYIRSRRQNV
jgi:thioredoxin reductase (NADPH)